ncbi:GNAT family N-acetyltransferase [Roseateles sp. DAIF2]|uniref:GNAT family N-acetyltransferase n=1 Tax=Roseateles sp. DAIF2 TaxID=2714952 RepID=UPI001BC9276D|nr:GNAT family N-acetyltransferase [Roseateles sp. DAIF2]
MQLETVAPGDPSALPALAALLQDVVAHGASLGFLAALDEAEARAYWQGVLDRLGPAQLLWTLSDAEGRLLGTVQLARCEKPNGRHRAEVQKLMVHSGARGRGLASRLLRALEAAARAMGCSLLVLDTEAGSAAEAVYTHLGWSKAGEIPHFAASPDGVLQPTALYYKLLG